MPTIVTKTSPKLARQLAAAELKVKAIYVSTYIPRECGIATYTKDLTNAINVLNPYYLADIVAIDDEKIGGEHRLYPWEVKFKVDQENPFSWIAAAGYINQSGADVVVLEHEFGIYGGKQGEYAIPFVEAITKPIVITFHTVIPEPDENLKKMVNRLCQRVDGIIVMVETAVERLVADYGVDRNKIVVIPHGVPDMSFGPTQPYKEVLGLEEYNILAGFGLLSKSKGYEYAIKALAEIVKTHPKTKLLILGETHPVVLRNEGDKYRQMLKRLVKKLNLENHVIFVNRYLSLDEIVDYLKATDIYITPFPGLSQITSGTLSYAIGAGKVCVSTPYLYAHEVLDNDRGVLVNPNDSDDLAEKIIELLNHPRTRQRIAKNAYAYGRNMIWHNVALRHLELFRIVAQKYNHELG